MWATELSLFSDVCAYSLVTQGGANFMLNEEAVAAPGPRLGKAGREGLRTLLGESAWV